MSLIASVRCLPLASLLALGVACGGASESPSAPCAGLLPGDLVITEYFNDPEGTDTGQEYIEVYNATRAPVDLRGLTLYAGRADGSQEKGYVFQSSVQVAAGDYMVLGDVREGPLPAHVDHAYGDALGSLGNTSGRLGLRCGERVMDEVPLSAPAKSGVARGFDGRLAPDSEGNDDVARWCDATEPFATGMRGSPGAANPPCTGAPQDSADGGSGSRDGGVDGGTADGGVDAGTPLTCVDRVTGLPRPPRTPEPGSLLITEYMADPAAVADTGGEWVEVLALREVDLNFVTLSNESNARSTLESRLCLTVKAGAYGVLARSEDTQVNGGLPAVLGTFGFTLANGAGTRALRLTAGNGVLLDETAYTRAAVPGVSQQLDPSRRLPSLNDTPEGFCSTPLGVLYGAGDRGTPGLENRPCVP